MRGGANPAQKVADRAGAAVAHLEVARAFAGAAAGAGSLLHLAVRLGLALAAGAAPRLCYPLSSCLPCRLRWLLSGSFDTKGGEYEWVRKSENERKSRRKFVL